MGELIGFNETTGQPVYAAAGVGKLVGFNRRTGRPVRAAAGTLGAYSELSPDFYKTFQPDNWQHAGSSGWTQAPVPGWGMNPNLQMFSRRGVNGLGVMPAYVSCAPFAVGALCIGALLGYLVKKR